MRLPLVLSVLLILPLLAGCSPSPQAAAAPASRDQSLPKLLAARDANRLYDGAPPVIPHQVAELGRENCISCHAPGANTNPDLIGPPRSHPAWGDCRQCHVERTTTAVLVSNEVTPLRWPAKGHRQTAISPPMIPHHLQNREDCAVCHIGEQAPVAIRAAHGYRPECRQCHLAMNP